jgi:hypothetical protein
MSNRYRHVATGVFVPLFIAVIGFLDVRQRPTFRKLSLDRYLPVGRLWNVHGHRADRIHRISTPAAIELSHRAAEITLIMYE